MVNLIFSPDIYRNYCDNDIQSYHSILKKLSYACKLPYNILDTTLNPAYTHNDWIKLQNKDSNIDEVYTQRDTLYVFFEIPEYLSLYFRNNGIPYINFMTSKLRFPGMDPCLMFESNICFKVNEYTEYPKYTPKLLQDYIGKTIAIGQMYGDRSVIFEGATKNLFDYEFKADIFRPHPLAIKHQANFSKSLEKQAIRNKIPIRTDGNIYDILHSANSFVGVSSSTLYEAQYIGKEVVFLQEKEYIKTAKLIKWSDINEGFWTNVVKEL